MSVLIKGMEMPTAYPLTVTIYPDGQVLSETVGAKDKHGIAVHVPPYGRLIDADALCKTLRSLAEREYTPEVFANWIENHIDSVIPPEEA